MIQTGACTAIQRPTDELAGIAPASRDETDERLPHPDGAEPKGEW